MRYESLLASRYIRAQKRQSIFTLLSIAVAVAVLTVFFVFYGVLLGNARAAAYQEAPYHLLIYEWPENKASALRAPAPKPTKCDTIPNAYLFSGKWFTSIDITDAIS